MPDETDIERLLEESARAETIRKAHMAAQGCTCDVTRRNILNVGKAVCLRNRLQAHFFESPSRRRSPWMEQYEAPPHEHLLFASVWFVSKPDLASVEATLIEKLGPRHNQRDKNGYGDAIRWPFRWPDLDGISFLDIEPTTSRKPLECRLKNVPGVYAWYYGNVIPKEPRPDSPLDAFLAGFENSK